MNPAESPQGAIPAIDLLFALSLAADMALGLPAGHGARAAYIGIQIAHDLGLSPSQCADLFYAELLMDAGCTAWTSYLATTIRGDEIAARKALLFETDVRDPRALIRWLIRYGALSEPLAKRARNMVSLGLRGKKIMLDAMLNTSEVAARIASRLGRSSDVQHALRCLFEQWDGSGPRGLQADAIPIMARVVHATIFLEVAHQTEGRDAAVTLARARRSTTLAPDVVDAFLRLANHETFWQVLEGEAIWEVVRQFEPDSAAKYVRVQQLDDVARAFADFADLKSFYSAGHSRRVATLAQSMASHLGSSAAELTVLRQAALLHDLGLVAVPSFVLHKPQNRLSVAEWESVRLHPYLAERILNRVPAFAAAVPLVAAHHEQPDGRGYHRGIRRHDIPFGACVIAVADQYDDLTHDGPERDALDPEEALHVLGQGVGSRFDRTAFESLAWALGRPLPESVDGETNNVNGRSETEMCWPAGLSNREVDVLRLAAKGLTRKQVAEELFVSPSTVRSHLEHIYTKIGVSTRAAATLFAVENDLII